MARQASSSIGGIAGGLVGVIIIGALVATPIYISTLETDRARLDSETETAVETVRRAVLNMDEHLVRIANLSERMANFGEGASEVTIPKERLDELQKMSQALRLDESTDSERGTEIADVRVAPPGGANRSATGISSKLKGLIAEHNKLMTEANNALRELQSASAGSLQGGNSLNGARIKAIYEYAAGRVSANHAGFLNWLAEESLGDASPLVSQLAQLKQLGQAIADESPVEVGQSIDEKIARLESEATKIKSQLDQHQQTIDEYKARIEQLDNTSRQNRLQMAEMQMRKERIDTPSSRYGQLAAEARDAESQADALRYGTLMDATRMMASPEDLIGLKYEGGTPIAGLFSLEQIAANLREQLDNLDAAQKALADQKRFYDAEEASVQTAMEQTQSDATDLAETIQQIMASAQTLNDESNKAADEAVKHLTAAGNAARTASTAASTWKREMEVPDAPAESPAAELNSLIRSDGHLQGAMQFLEGECAYQIALARYNQIQLANALNDLQIRAAEASSVETTSMPTDAVEAWRNEALTQLAKAETAYGSAGKSFMQTQATLDGRRIQGKDTVWQAQAGQAAVHLLRSILKEDATERKAEKDAAYDLLQEAAKDRERSPLLTPTVDMILELQSNPS